MTKKTQNIIETYKEKLETHLFLNHNGFCNWEKSYDNMMKEQHQLENMLSSMFFYSLISNKDHDALCHVPSRICEEYKEKLLFYKTEEEYNKEFASKYQTV